MRFRRFAESALVACSLLLAPLAARADLTITQQVEGAGGSSEMTVQMKDDHMRADLAAQVSMLLDLKTGETLFLQHEPKTFSRLTAAQSAAMVKKFQDAIPPGAGKLEATTQKREISGYPTDLFIWTIGAMKLRFWVARDLPGGKVLQERLDRLQASGPFASVAALLPPPGSLPGVRLRTEMEVGAQKVSYTITGLKQDPLDEKLFALPPDYKEVPFAIAPGPTP
jgi:hypothetical protein